MGIFPNIGDVQNSRVRTSLFWGGSAVLTAALVVVYHWDPETAGFFPVCPFRTVTGYYCPGCGMTRALHQLMHGNILLAANYNLLFVVSAPFCAYWCISQFTFVVFGYNLPRVRIPDKLLWAAPILVVAFGVIRNFSFYPFTLLAPH